MKPQRATAGPQFVLWSGSSGMLVLVGLGRVEGRAGFLEPPFDFVGPLPLDELETHGRIPFGACLIMSRKRWREDQAELRRESYSRRQAQAQRLSSRLRHPVDGDARHREILELPRDGVLDAAEIKAAFRRQAKITHPDGGGSSELFQRVTEARDALLERARQTLP